MSAIKTKIIAWTGVAIVLVAAVIIIIKKKEVKTTVADNHHSAAEYIPPPVKDSIPAPVRIAVLPDSTKVFLTEGSDIDSGIKYKKTREIRVNGDMFFEIPAGVRPLTVRSDLLILSVAPETAFRIIAYRGIDGEEVQVLSGNIKVKKSYKSEFSEPDTLRGNQSIMINRSIDLMEKEKFDSEDLRRWKDNAERIFNH